MKTVSHILTDQSHTDIRNAYTLLHHQHDDHVHFKLIKKGNHEDSHHDHSHHDHSHDDHSHDDHSHQHHEHDEHCEPCGDGDDASKKKIGRNDEGCPCCAAAIDLDEVAVALNEINANGANLESNEHSLAELANFSSAAHWGIFLGIAGPLGLIGLTAAYRNIKGTINNKSKLDAVIKGLEEDIARLIEEQRDAASPKVKENLSGVIQRLEAFRKTLEYSRFDTKFNLVVPGFINGAASTVVLSSAIVVSPWALPIIALYAGCQTTRNAYDLWRTWNKILPENIREEVQLNVKVGIRKINQITDSKRKFYAANTLGFAAFTAGATVTTLSALSVIGTPGLAVGIPLLAVGAVSTGITNNIWTNKFKPRNADLGIDRTELDLERIQQEIGERREIKKLLKNYRDKHLPSKAAKRFGCSLLSSMPFGNKKGAKLLHEVNQSRISESDSRDADRLDPLERIINAKIVLKKTGNHQDSDLLLKKISALGKISKVEKEKFGLFSINEHQPLCEQIFAACRDLEIDTMVLERFIKNAIIKSLDEHDTSINNREAYLEKLTQSRLFQISGDEISFDIKALEVNDGFKKAFMSSLEECLLFDYVEKLKYEQYGLNDFYWALDKQNKMQPHSHGHKHHHHKHGHSHGHHDHDHGHHDHHEHHNHSLTDVHDHHPSLCRPRHLAPQTIKSAAEHEHSHHEHHKHEHHPASTEDLKSAIPETKQKLLSEFKSIVTEKISQNKTERHAQVTKQNEVIDKILEGSREFLLESKVENREENKTIFTYLDPDHTHPDDPDYKEKQVIYIQDDSTGKIDVVYGAKSSALVIERPNEVKNGVITKIDEIKVEHYGKINDSCIFKSFNKFNSCIESPTGGLHQASSQNLTDTEQNLQSHH